MILPSYKLMIQRIKPNSAGLVQVLRFYYSYDAELSQNVIRSHRNPMFICEFLISIIAMQVLNHFYGVWLSNKHSGISSDSYSVCIPNTELK